MRPLSWVLWLTTAHYSADASSHRIHIRIWKYQAAPPLDLFSAWSVHGLYWGLHMTCVQLMCNLKMWSRSVVKYVDLVTRIVEICMWRGSWGWGGVLVSSLSEMTRCVRSPTRPPQHAKQHRSSTFAPSGSSTITIIIQDSPPPKWSCHNVQGTAINNKRHCKRISVWMIIVIMMIIRGVMNVCRSSSSS